MYVCGFVLRAVELSVAYDTEDEGGVSEGEGLGWEDGWEGVVEEGDGD